MFAQRVILVCVCRFSVIFSNCFSVIRGGCNNLLTLKLCCAPFSHKICTFPIYCSYGRYLLETIHNALQQRITCLLNRMLRWEWRSSKNTFKEQVVLRYRELWCDVCNKKCNKVNLRNLRYHVHHPRRDSFTTGVKWPKDHLIYTRSPHQNH